MNFTKNLFINFARDFMEIAKLCEENYTIFPTIIFLTFTYIFFYLILRKFSSPFHNWKRKLSSHVKLQLAFFFVASLWFIFLQNYKTFLQHLEGYVQINSHSEQIEINIKVTRFCFLILLTSLAQFPVILICFNCLYTDEIPYLLMWVPENPWHRHELGTSGQYLTNQTREQFSRIPQLKNKQFQSRKSTSLDERLLQNCNSNRLARGCQSVVMIRERM